MTQTWHDLLFAHWPVPTDRLRTLVPASLDIDRFEGQGWIAVVPFHMTNVTPRHVPAHPWFSSFPELNVRTYVVRDGRPGVYFFSLDAANALAVTVARTLFHLPYFKAAMSITSADGWFHYVSRRTRPGQAVLRCRYRPIAPSRMPVAGTLEHFLTERYCLYTTDRSGRPLRLEIHHGPWQLQDAELDVEVNTMAEAAGVPLPPVAPLLHFSKRQDVVTYPMERV